jgi:rRNA-processing protein FCF1
LLAPTLIGDHLPKDTLSQFSLCNLEDIDDASTKWLPLPQVLTEFPEHARVWLVDSDAKFVSLPKQAGSRQAIIIFDQSIDSDGVVVKWNEARDGCLVTVKGVYPLRDAFLASNQFVSRGRRIRLKIGQEQYEIPLVLRVDVAEESDGIAETLDYIATTFRRSGIDENAVVPALWQSEQNFWQSYLDDLNGHSFSFIEKVKRLQLTKKCFMDVVGEMQTNAWDSSIAHTFLAHLNQGEMIIHLDEMSELISAIQQCNLSSTNQVETIVQAAIERVQLPSSLLEFGQITAALRKNGPAWQVPFPSQIYTPEVLAAISHEFPKPILRDYFANENDFDKCLRELMQTYEEIISAVGASFEGLVTEDAYLDLLKLPNAGKITDLAESWTNQYTTFSDKYRVIVPNLSGASLGSINDRIGTIVGLSRKLIGGLDPKFRSVFILDTSALIESPELLKAIRHDEFIVVSKRVIDELDDKKRDEELRPSVAKATRGLQEFPKAQIQFCDGDMTLLSPDYRMKGDNLILSVAVRYRKHRPVLLTNDKNLALKAKAENIIAMSVDEFEKRPRPRTSIPTPIKNK